jgi:hypothetical protein
MIDTGSSDGSQSLAREAWGGIPGILFERPWVDFGHNRTEALKLAREAIYSKEVDADWIFFLDADDTLEISSGFSWPDAKRSADAYYIRVKRPGGVFQEEQAQVLLFKADKPWVYKGKTHEYPECRNARIEGPLDDIWMVYRQDSVRHRSGRRSWDDATFLEKEMEEDPSNPRWVHYAAQSHRDANNLARALDLYLKRMGMGGWDQERWSASLEAAKLHERLGHPISIVTFAYLTAHKFRPHRPESLAHLARYLRNNGWEEVAAVFDSAWRSLPPTTDILAVEKCCQWTGKTQKGLTNG